MQISSKFVPMGLFNKKPVLIQIMVWHQTGGKPLTESMMAEFTDAYMSLDSLQWRHNDHDGVSNHQPHDCLLNRLFKAQIKENIKALRHWPLWGEFPGGRRIPRTNGQ